MSLIGSLVNSLRRTRGARTWTPDEVRDLIAARWLDEALAATGRLSPQLVEVDAHRACLLGEIRFQQRRDDEAAACFAEALRAVPGMPQAHYGLSLCLAEKDDHDAAVRHAFFATAADPRNGRYLAQLGYAHLRLNNMRQAENPLRRATLALPGNCYVWNNLGIVLRAKGWLDEALDCFRRAAEIDPEFEAAREHLKVLCEEMAHLPAKSGHSKEHLHLLAPLIDGEPDARHAAIVELEQSGELQRAIGAAEALVLDHPDDMRAAFVLARLYERAGDIESAIDALRAYLSVHPSSSEAAGALGLVQLRANDFVAAEPLLRDALASRPEHLDYLVALGSALTGQEKFAAAAEFIDRALSMSPDDVGLMGLRAGNLANQCRYDEAMQIIDELKAMGLQVGCSAAVLTALGRFDEALEAAERDLALNPSDPANRFHRGGLHLLMGHYDKGWDDYAYRGLSSAHFRILPFPLWRGEPLEGKQIIVLTEQGLGDQIMLSSCLPDLLGEGARRVVVEMTVRVAKTVSRSFPECEVVATKQNSELEWVKRYPETDYYVPLGDLPGRYRRSLAAFPQRRSYLVADPARIAHWRGQLECRGPGPYIGLSWRGGTEATRSPLRSFTPEQLLPLSEGFDATWICLQYGKVQDDVERMAEAGMPLQYWPESIADLDEFAALICALDLVVTVCNTTVHYAGALGKPVWIMAPKVPEWRYGLDTPSLPWYPSSRMFRQGTAGDWTEVVQRIRREMSALRGEP